MDRKAVPLLTSAGPVLESPTPGLDLFTFRDQNCPSFRGRLQFAPATPYASPLTQLSPAPW